MESTSTFSYGDDKLGTYIRFSVDGNIYSDIAILKTAYWFTEHHYLFIDNSLHENKKGI